MVEVMTLMKNAVNAKHKGLRKAFHIPANLLNGSDGNSWQKTPRKASHIQKVNTGPSVHFVWK